MENLFLNKAKILWFFGGFFSRKFWNFFLALITSCYPKSLEFVATKIDRC
jgi:hypothetical protein